VYQQEGQWYADGIFSDVTERRHAEERMRRLSEELDARVRERTAELQKTEESFRQANRKLNLLSSITRHDILNQLTIMTGYLKLAGDRVPDPEVKKYLATAQHAGEVIDRHMVFTKLYQNIGVHSPVWQNVGRLMQRVREDFPEGSILLQVETGDLELYADPLLEKVFFTLLENTIRHGEHASVVRLTYTLGDADLTLVYEDNGTGIGSSEKERIFEWGYGRHTGFGLFLSREILAITGLAIRESGEAGRGARFEITVPLAACRFSPPAPGKQE
jgi:signal transduction histidine kinase